MFFLVRHEVALLSPLLFALYISDIERYLKEHEVYGIKINQSTVVDILLFADDTVVLAPTAGALKEKIRLLEVYFDNLDLDVNLGKTKIIVFRKGGCIEKDVKFSFKGKPIEIVDDYVYLGILMTTSSLFRRQMERAKKKAMEVLYTTLGLIFKTKLASFHAHYTLFESIVKSTLLYSCAVWSHRYKSDLEPVQNNYYRRLLGLHPQLSTAIVRSESASRLLEVSIWEQTLCFVGKIKMMDNRRYARKIFDRLHQLNAESPSWEYNWVTQVERGLMAFGLGGLLSTEPEEWSENYQASMKIINDHFVQDDQYSLERLERWPQYAQVFRNGIRNEPTTAHREETRWSRLPWHLKSDMSLKIKRMISQLRQGSVYLRHNDTIVSIPHEMDEVECPYCNRKAADCPQHAILECPVTAVTSQTLREEGWEPTEYMTFLNDQWENPERTYKLLMQCIRMRQLITSEAESQATKDG